MGAGDSFFGPPIRLSRDGPGWLVAGGGRRRGPRPVRSGRCSGR